MRSSGAGLVRRLFALLLLPVACGGGARSGVAGQAEAQAKSAERAAQERETMIEVDQVIGIARRSASAARSVADIIVEPGADRYTVTLTYFGAFEEQMTSGLVFAVDRQTGVVLETENVTLKNPFSAMEADFRGVKLISGFQAYESAIEAIRGYERQDKTGRTTVVLLSTRYEVTLPEASELDARSADYAYQIWIDPRSGEVLKILVAS